MKRDKHDALFSQLVRERANWRCESCGKIYPEGSRQGLHCSHFFTRSRKSVRWHPLNAAAHCYSCHTRLGGSPIDFADWIRDYLSRWHSDLCGDRLVSDSRKLVRWRKADLEELYSEMKKELSRMEELRRQGETGRLDFALPKVNKMLEGA